MVTKRKLIHHKWKKTDRYQTMSECVCEVCGCRKYWDFSYKSMMFEYGTHLTYNSPSCKLPNTLDYNGKRI